MTCLARYVEAGFRTGGVDIQGAGGAVAVAVGVFETAEGEADIGRAKPVAEADGESMCGDGEEKIIPEDRRDHHEEGQGGCEDFV